jgi:exonuclease III
MRVVVWNMQSKIENWGKIPEFEADVALLCEARVAEYPLADQIIGGPTTEGFDFPRPWSAAVVSRHQLIEITDAKASRRGKPIDLPFRASRSGSWTAAIMRRERAEDVTVISLYGLMDEKSDASMHRSLSELTPLFEDNRHRHRLLLGGDFNVLAAPGRKDPVRARHLLVLERIKAFGLVDCLERKRPPGPLEACPCGFGDDCRHTWTKFDPQRPTVAYQDDYLFASPALADTLDTCAAYDPRAWASVSDHAPIVAEFGA